MNNEKQKIIELLCSSDKENIELAEMLCLSQNINLEELLEEYGYSDLELYSKESFLNHDLVVYGYLGNYIVNYVPKLLPGNIKTIIAMFFSELHNITELPELDKRTNNLYCNDNKLTYLPELPNSVSKLFCENNKLISLPELPDKLGVLDCSNNQLTHILNKPMPNLRELICNGNPLIQSLDEIRTLVPESCYIKY